MRTKTLFPLIGLTLLAGCAPYGPPPPGLGPWFGPKRVEEFLETLLLLGLLVLLVLGVVWLLRGLRGASPLPNPFQGGSALPSRLEALRRQAQGLEEEKRRRIEEVVLAAWEAWGRGDRAQAEALAAKGEALLELLKNP
ncbi:hypothetical protein TJA_16030 [Thermus sp. LT1-2-5]|uniref:hypothetical protein n=1 Tax=Thermus sp. LT1-2-5 TaxID=3026935 RepID=UPI0030E98F81